jgi:putative Mg2+ transporter-C (MgtC) family protein
MLTTIDIIIRLCVSFAAGIIIGFERASRHQVAGIRTHVLICLGATLLMVLSIWLPQEYNYLKNGDPGRIAAQIVSGIGFLGAGAMIRLGNNIKGLTTASSLWLVAAIGMTIGAGLFLAAGIVEVLAIVTLWGLGEVEKRIFPSERNKILELHFKNSIHDTKDLLHTVKAFGVRVQSMDVDAGDKKGIKLRLLVGLPNTTDVTQLIHTLKEIKGLDNVELKEKY